MRVLATFALIAFVAAATAAGRSDDATEKDLKALVGKWKVEKAELGGNDAMALFKGLTLEISKDGKYTVVLGDLKDSGKLVLDPSKIPAEMSITGIEGPNKDKTIKAIYKLDGDTVTICYALTGGDRPAKFEAKEAQHFLAVYQREKK